MKRIVLITVLLLLAAVVKGGPVKNMPTRVVQPSGDTLECLVTGDEFYHRMHDAAGYTIVQDAETGWYVYARKAEGNLWPTAWVPGRDNPALAGLTPGLMPDKSVLRARRKAWEVPAELVPTGAKTSGRNHGVLNNVVVFIRFSDETVCTNSPMSAIDSMFNDSVEARVSMFNYFWHTSYRKLRVKTHFFPEPTGNTVVSFQDSLPRNYYRPYSSTNPIGYSGDTQRRNREFSLLERAINWLDATNAVPAGLNLDMDNDGLVDNICFVLSGTYTGWGDLLWPHKWAIYDRSVYLAGKQVYVFNLQLAGSGQHYFGVSTLCHEMTHTLGCPDLYHYDNYSTVSPAGTWDLMCANQTDPQQSNSLFKYKYLNWFDSIPELRDSGTYTMQSLATGPNHAYKIKSSKRHQWYILEYRNTTDTFDRSLPNRGLLVWRYNDASVADNADFDFDTVPHELWLFRPGSSVDTVDGNVAAAAFGVSGRNSFGTWTNPHPYLCDGTPDSSFSLTNIQISSDRSTVSFQFTPHGIGPCGTVSTFPLEETFEDGTEGCWNFVSMDPANDGQCGVRSTPAAHNGIYHFAFSSYNGASDYNQYLISPWLQASSALHLIFYYERSYVGTEQLKVKYSTTTDDLAAFGQTLTTLNVTTDGWQRCDVMVPAGARYVALNYCSNYQYDLYVDDIMLRDTLDPNDTIVRDTTFVYVHDTIARVIYDTVLHVVTDTVRRVVWDTVYRYVHDTVEQAEVYWVDSVVYDTVVVDAEVFEISVGSNNQRQGRASGSGRFRKNTVVEIAALANAGYRFVQWMDGSSENPRRVTMSSDLLFTAYFAEDTDPGAGSSKRLIEIHDTIVVRDTVWVDEHVTVMVTQRDTVWAEQHETVYVEMRDTVYVTVEGYDTVYNIVHELVEWDTTRCFEVVLHSNDESMGVAAGNGCFEIGTAVELGAVAKPGYHFVRWTDGAVQNPRTIVVTGDVTLVAVFAPGATAGVVTPQESEYRIYAQEGCIVVEQAGAEGVEVFDVMGRQVWTNRGAVRDAAVCRTPRMRRGVYLVRVGKGNARKVSVF